MTPGKKQAFEPTGLIPRSIVRTFERFYKQLLPKTKYSAIREYRISRYQVLVSIRCLCTLLILPLVTRVITNWLIFSYALPQIKYFWDVTYQDEHVFSEIDQFSQVLFFDSLLDAAPSPLISSVSLSRTSAKTPYNFGEGRMATFPVQNKGKKVFFKTETLPSSQVRQSGNQDLFTEWSQGPSYTTQRLSEWSCSFPSKLLYDLFVLQNLETAKGRGEVSEIKTAPFFPHTPKLMELDKLIHLRLRRWRAKACATCAG